MTAGWGRGPRNPGSAARLEPGYDIRAGCASRIQPALAPHGLARDLTEVVRHFVTDMARGFATRVHWVKPVLFRSGAGP